MKELLGAQIERNSINILKQKHEIVILPFVKWKVESQMLLKVKKVLNSELSFELSWH